MIIATGQGDREIRAFGEEAARIPSPAEAGGTWSYAGRYVSRSDAIGLPAAMAAIRLISETAGTLPLKVFKGGEPATDSSQWSVLHDRPNDDQTPSQLWSFVYAELNTTGNAFLQKLKSGRQVVGLYPLESCYMRVKREAGRFVFEYQQSAGKTTKLTRDDVIHIPGVLVDDPYVGLSPISAHRHALGTALAMQEFAGRFYANDATPGGTLSVPGNLNRSQAEELRENWDSMHRGRSGRVAVLSNGAEYTPISLPLRDAQFVEQQNFTTEQIAQIFKIPADLLTGKTSSMSPEEESIRFVRHSLRPWLVKVEQALGVDPDLFPSGLLKPRFDADELLRPDQGKRYEGYVKARQAGWLSPNEIREREGYPPIDGGDEVQLTPVGGAPNPTQTQQ